MLEVALNIECCIHHIGSTSVPNLISKPIIDILIEVNDLAQLDMLPDKFFALGYESRGENGIAGRRYFVKGYPERTHQIHAFKAKSHDVTRHLAVRDYLRTNPDACIQYAEIKRNAVARCENDIHKYVAFKSEFVSCLEVDALAQRSHMKEFAVIAASSNGMP